MRLSQAALDLQLAAESEARHATLAELSAQVAQQFANVVAAVDPETAEPTVPDACSSAPRRPNPIAAPPAGMDKPSLVQSRLPVRKAARVRGAL
jgi:hypothetical protein